MGVIFIEPVKITEATVDLINAILQRGNTAEIKNTKDRVIVLEVSRKIRTEISKRT